MITKPKGTYDLMGLDAKISNYINHEIENFMINYNYEFIRTPVFEATELFHRTVGDGTDIVTKETYDFKDRGDRDITLRPEGTAGVVRSVIENKLYGNKNDPIKLYYNETMYRYERPQSGRFREFTQFGVEVFNSDDVLIDTEVISLGFNLLNSLGLEDVLVKLNTLGDAKSRTDYSAALVNYFKPHIHELCEDCQKRINTNPLRILDCKVDKDNDILKNAPKISEFISDESKDRFNKLKSYLDNLEIDYEIDESIVRGLDYYDECVWEYKLDDDVALGGGGRYNTLVKNLGGPELPGIGFALGIERIILKLKEKIDEQKINNFVDVYIMSVSEEEKIYAIKIAQDLRLNNVITEINGANLSLKSQFKIADNLNAKFLIILRLDFLDFQPYFSFKYFLSIVSKSSSPLLSACTGILIGFSTTNK